jgi:hypothetical protein
VKPPTYVGSAASPFLGVFVSSTIVAKFRAGRNKTSATDKIDQRFSQREAQLRDEQAWRSSCRQRRTLRLSQAVAEAHPLLAAHLVAHGDELPKVQRDCGGRARRLEAMRQAHGQLVLLTICLPTLAAVPFYSAGLARRAKLLTTTAVQRLTTGPCALEAAIQRGGRYEGVHAHVCLPLAALRLDFRTLVEIAPSGPGGGWALAAFWHAVRIRDTPTDRLKVARYTGRHPDGRFGLHVHDPARLLAFEELLARRQTGRREPALTWFTR